ncbi:MAG TPA: tripartite tricarboxylate transporter substrate binding protein [Xanthobacteraceae bacterium]|nr:tripartite tricarboxylate transporter substrate binding protein [Xanthobacteraceae bacterium]
MQLIAWHRRARTAGLMALALITVLCQSARAQTDPAANYPSKTIKIVVGFAAGGGNDIIARIIGQKLQEGLGQTVIIENKVGAGGSLAALSVMAAPPDGYTLLVGASGAMSIIPAISVRPPYTTLRDFAPISNLASFPLILSTYPSHQAKNVQELVSWMKANPDKANYATASSAFTLTTELFKLRTGAPGTAIPYKSSNESLVSVIGQQSLFAITDPPPTTPQVKGGQIRALAVTSATRLEDLPDVPTMAEAGVTGMEVGLWSGVFAPAATPPGIIRKLETELRKIMQMADVKEKFKAMATPTVGSTAAEFAQLIERETKMWAEVGHVANVKLE